MSYSLHFSFFRNTEKRDPSLTGTKGMDVTHLQPSTALQFTLKSLWLLVFPFSKPARFLMRRLLGKRVGKRDRHSDSDVSCGSCRQIKRMTTKRKRLSACWLSNADTGLSRVWEVLGFVLFVPYNTKESF